MGRDKATLPIGAGTLLERVAAELRHAFSPLLVVAAAAADQPSAIDLTVQDVVLIRDEIAFQGPVHALKLGLAAARGEYGFVAACDLPMLRAEVALGLCAMLADHDAVIARVGGRLQMLHAVYRRRRCLSALTSMEGAGERALHAIVGRVNARIVEEAEMRLIDPQLESFINVNTPEDYRRARNTIERA